MPLLVRDVMNEKVLTVEPALALPELEREFLASRVGAFPVVDGTRLVGLVSRSDVVRQLVTERSYEEYVSDFYYSDGGGDEGGADQRESLEEIASRSGARLASLRVEDVMSRSLITTSADEELASAAATMVERRIHRLPVTESERLVGIVASLDLVRLFADGRVRAT